jgi:serine/threonine-protein kinase
MRLKREVALKILSESFATDPDRLARFQREAEVLASLNHPNIAAIYGIEESNGTRALVMELVEGETLAERIARGPLPVDEAMFIAKQIAEALEAAHEHGIIHRDLKPANVKVRADGVVKVLDFGLAKALETPSAGNANVTASPTITSPVQMTGVGVLLGTAAYMSPEQARGKAVDKRSDIWAFGCVLYEMLTGKRAFGGEDATDTLAAVVRSEPAWDALPDSLSPSVRLFQRRCLQKNPKQRLHDIADMRLALEGAFEVTGLHPAQAVAQAVWGRSLPFVVMAVLAVLVTTLAARSLWFRAEALWVTRFDHVLPEGQEFRNLGRSLIAISPDGQSFVYNAAGGLYVRRMEELQARLIPGTERGLTNPFFSPSGEFVAYEQAGELKRMSVSGGAPVVICATVTALFGATWTPDNMIYFGQPAGIMRVSANGGTPEPIIAANEGEQFDGPQLLPDGDSLLFSLTTGKGTTRWDQAQIVVQSLRTGERKIVLRGGSAGRYVPTGHLIYAVGQTLFAVEFDANRLEVDGGAVSVVEGIIRSDAPANTSATANYSVSENGTLVFATGATVNALGMLVWVDRNGKAAPLTERHAPYRAPRVSPDGARVAVTMRNLDGNDDIWVIDTERGTHTRLTSDPASDIIPLWTPDGRRLVFSSNRTGAGALYWMAADGSGVEEELTKAATNQGATSWLPDGTTLTFYDVGGTYDIFTVKPGETPLRLTQTPFQERGPAFSPDGRWLAYSSNETGASEIYVMPYPGPGGRIAISQGGGRSPRWSSNGRELFYRNGRQMMVVAVEPGPTFRVGTQQVLFEGDYVQEVDNSGAHNYDLSPDGKRFLMVALAPSEAGQQVRQRLVVVQNWLEELTRRVPTN